jgi:hypothetical protein
MIESIDNLSLGELDLLTSCYELIQTVCFECGMFKFVWLFKIKI